MWVRYALLAAAFAAVTSVDAQSCTVPPVEAISIFELADAFGDDVSVTPFDDVGAFPWWIRDAESVPVGVVEEIYLDESGAVPRLMLDAQHLDGNDFIASAPYADRAQTWGCE